MAEIKSNEREFMSLLASWLNEFLRSGSYPFKEVTSETSIKTGESRTRFPDIQIWLNREMGEGFAGWELKTPATPADDPELLENAAEKARAMRANYFVTWNMRDAVIWRMPHAGEKVSADCRYKTYPCLYRVQGPDDLWVATIKEEIKSRAGEILHDLATIHRDGHLHLIDIDTVYFVNRLAEAVNTLKPSFRDALIKEEGENQAFRKGLEDWAVKQGIAAHNKVEAFYDQVTRQKLYRLFAKIIFYLTLTRFNFHIPKLDIRDISYENLLSRLDEYFEAARNVDYQAVFEEDFIDKAPLPKDGAEVLSNFVDDLNRFNFSRMPHDVVGNVFERLIPPEERHTLGQYFTNENLVDLIIAFCVRTRQSNVLDPTCGTGTFLIRAYDRLNNFGLKDHAELLSRIWGIDVAHFPAELAVINLYRKNLESYANFPRILARDFFEIKPGGIFEFPPPKPPEAADFKIKEKLPAFDAIVGNFPYIRQEIIERSIEGYKGKLIEALSIGWREDYPELFENGDIRLSGQADIYAYMFFHAAAHLKEGGRMGIVTSNSWLDVAYGYELQKFFLKRFKLIAVLESRCEPWFEDAAVNTVVTIIERCSDYEKRAENYARFIKIKKPLKELIPWDINYPMQRWHGLDRLVNAVEDKGCQYDEIVGGKRISTLKGHATYEDDNFRIRVARQGCLLDEVEKAGKTVKWGKFLRAPNIYFEITEKCGDLLVPLNKVADIRRGYTTGINEFFYLTQEKIEHWHIEDEYLAPVIKSPKEGIRIHLSAQDVQNKIFICHATKKELRKKGTMGAFRYIEWGEKQVTREGIPWPEVPSVSNRGIWYDLGVREPGQILLQMVTNDRYFALNNTDKLHVDHNLFELFPKEDNYLTGLALFLNSSVAALFREIISRVNLGDGATKTEGIDWNDLMTPCGNIIAALSKEKRLFKSLQDKTIKSIFDEIKMKEKHSLDGAVLEALGLDPDKYLKPLYEGLTGMVRERLELAKSRKKLKSAKSERNHDKLKDRIIEEFLPDGPKKFPEDFISGSYLKDAEEIPVPGEALKMGAYFMGRQEVISDDGFKYDAESRDTAKFIIYAQKENSYIVKIPRKKPAIIKAVDEYERYVKDLKSKLIGEFNRRILDHKKAEILTAQALTELNIPEIL